MPTNEERREVAARLLDMADSRYCDTKNTLVLAGALLTVSGVDAASGTSEDIMRRLADLIEPEERTCRMEYDNSKRGVYCSHCGARMDVYTWEHHVDGTAGYLYPFCYWCGSKVVEE